MRLSAHTAIFIDAESRAASTQNVAQDLLTKGVPLPRAKSDCYRRARNAATGR